jgi:hypothetical protein
MKAYRERSARCLSVGLRAEESPLTAPQKSAEDIVGARERAEGLTLDRSSGLQWSGEIASGEVSDNNWHLGCTHSTPGNDAPVGVYFTLMVSAEPPDT